jgi:N-acetylglucosaminyldiphosphoundecaprenol N-acetyl-beta-D-mannosaminyltransferase
MPVAVPRGTLGEQAARTRHVRLRGARFAAVTEEEAVQRILDAAAMRRGHWTITANLDHLRRYSHEEVARDLLDDADLVVADGMPLVWASRLVRCTLPGRVAGSSMIWSLAGAARDRNQSVFLLGGDPGVAERAAEVLRARYEGLRVAGTLCPAQGFEHDEDQLSEIVRRAAQARPAIVFVGLGFPKQDLLIQRLRAALPCASFIGVGISMSFVAGELSRAPTWTQRAGLEWLYRMVQEPRRLTKRYLVHGAPFALRLLVAAGYRGLRADPSSARWGTEPERSGVSGRRLAQQAVPVGRPGAGRAHSQPSSTSAVRSGAER